MPPVQTTVELTHPVAVEGAVVDGQLKNIISAVATETIPFGRFVMEGATPGSAALPVGSAGVGFDGLGVSVRSQDDVANAAGVLQHEAGSEVSIIDFGVVYLRPETAVTLGIPLYVRHTAGAGGSELGRVRNNADTNTATQLAGIVPMADGLANELVPVSVRLRA